jgi:hypothetical protein
MKKSIINWKHHINHFLLFYYKHKSQINLGAQSYLDEPLQVEIKFIKSQWIFKTDIWLFPTFLSEKIL